MILSQRIEIKPNKELKAILEDYFNYSRYIYNKGLATWNTMYDKYKETNDKQDLPHYYKVRDYLKANKEDWEENYPKQILETSSQNVNYAFNLFFKKESKLPKYKSKKGYKKSFRIYRKNEWSIQIRTKKEIDNNPQRNCQFYKFVDPDNSNRKYLKLQGIKQYIKMKECLRFDGIIKECTISYVNFKYYASFRVELDDNYIDNTYEINYSDKKDFIGIDLGVKNIAIINDSNGLFRKYKSLVKVLKPYYMKVDYYNRILSRKVPNSKNYEKTRAKLNHNYLRIKNIRKDYLDKITTFIALNYRNIVIESLKVKNLSKNRRLSKVIWESCFYTFRCMLEYKSKLYKSNLIIAKNNFPSTQLCSKCGNRLTKHNKITLKQRTYKCPKCGFIIDRDFNSSINLKLYGMNIVGMAN
jgi:putative transposase